MKTFFFRKLTNGKKRKFQTMHFSLKTLRKKRHFSAKIDLIKLKKNKIKIKKNYIKDFKN